MSVTHDLLSRLEIGRPLLLSGDALASLGVRGAELGGPVPIARLLREAPEAVAAHHHQEIVSGVDVLCALTAETTPRGLAQIGMAFRAALLTSSAVDLALEAADFAPRPVFVAGVLAVTPASHGGRVAHPPADRIVEEYAAHAARLAAAGCQLIIARGFGAVVTDPELARIARRAAVISAAATGLATWAVVEVEEEGGFSRDGEAVEDWAATALDTGAQALLVQVDRADAGASVIERIRAAFPDAKVGALLGAGAEARAGDGGGALDDWAAGAKRLVDAGARVIGGGPGAVGRHLVAFTRALRGHERQSLWPGAP